MMKRMIRDSCRLREALRLAMQVSLAALISVTDASWASGFPLFSPSAMTQGFQGTAYEARYAQWKEGNREIQAFGQNLSYRFANRAVLGIRLPYVTGEGPGQSASGFSNPVVGARYRFYDRAGFRRLTDISFLSEVRFPAPDESVGVRQWGTTLGPVYSSWQDRTVLEGSLLWHANGGGQPDALAYNLNVAYRIWPASYPGRDILLQIEWNGVSQEGGNQALWAAPSLQSVLGNKLVFFAYRIKVSGDPEAAGLGPNRQWVLGMIYILY